MKHVVGISEMKISGDPGDELITYSLGSCLGLSLFDPSTGIGGLIHCMLPLSKIDPEKASTTPGMFTDTGVLLLLQTMFNAGANKSSLIAKVAGCSRILDEKGLFNIGERNYTVMRKILWKNDILIKAENIGGTLSRTLSLRINSGVTILKCNGVEREL